MKPIPMTVAETTAEPVAIEMPVEPRKVILFNGEKGTFEVCIIGSKKDNSNVEDPNELDFNALSLKALLDSNLGEDLFEETCSLLHLSLLFFALPETHQVEGKTRYGKRAVTLGENPTIDQSIVNGMEFRLTAGQVSNAQAVVAEIIEKWNNTALRQDPTARLKEGCRFQKMDLKKLIEELADKWFEKVKGSAPKELPQSIVYGLFKPMFCHGFIRDFDSLCDIQKLRETSTQNGFNQFRDMTETTKNTDVLPGYQRGRSAVNDSADNDNSLSRRSRSTSDRDHDYNRSRSRSPNSRK